MASVPQEDRASRAASPTGFSSSSSPSRAPGDLVIVTFLVTSVLVLLANAPALDAWFAADDFLWLDISRLDDVLHSFVGPWGHGAAWRPLSRVSFYVDYLLFGLDARPWHAVNLLWHITAATLLGALLYRLTRDATFSLATTAIFALLPMQYENTLWISARSHPIALAGALASLIVLDRHLLEHSRKRLLGSAALLAAALLTYEAAVYTVPLAVLVVLARRHQASPKTSLVAVGTLCAVLLAYLAARRQVLAGANLYAVRPAGEYLTAAFGRRLLDVGGALAGQIAPSPWWFVAAGAIAALVEPRTIALAATGALVVAIGFAPFAVVEGFGPRFAYASQAGVAMLLAAAVTGLARLRLAGRPLAALLLAALLLHASGETRQIAREWQEAGAIGRRSLARLTESWTAPDPARPAVIVGAPASHGRALIFFTYFDRALATFYPDHAGLRIPDHVLTSFAPRTSHAIAVDAWRREQKRRQANGLPEIVCHGRRPDRTRDVDAFVRALASCGAVFYAIDPDARGAYELTRAHVAQRIARGWRKSAAGSAG